MSTLTLRDIKIGTLLKLKPNCPKMYEILGSVGSYKLTDINPDKFLFKVTEIEIPYNLIYVKLIGGGSRVGGGWFPHRFVLAEQRTKEEQLLDKINYLWNKQEYVKCQSQK